MGIISEFREFALKGNVVDLAVGVIIGAAFGGVTKSMVDDILMPPIANIVGNLDFSNMYISLSEKVNQANTAVRLPLAEARKLGPVIAYGNFITVIINFVIVAFCVFVVVKLMNMAKRRFEKQQAAGIAPLTPDQQLLTEIRDLLKRS